MKHTHGGDQEYGADTDNTYHDAEPQRGRGRSKLSPPLQIPKNRSTGNLAVVSETAAPEHPTSRVRFSFDAGSASYADYDSIARSPLITEHDHGLGPSGLRRIRQNPLRTPTLPSSAASSRSPSIGLARSSSMVAMLPAGHQSPLTPGSGSPHFTEDLSRFPSESLHSFSFAQGSEDFLQNRQSVLKRGLEFMKDRMGWAVSSNAALASAQARVTGDVETQTMLDLLARAQLLGAGNLPNADSGPFVPGPLTGPPEISGENIFDNNFIPRTSSPEPYSSPLLSPSNPRTLQSVPEAGASLDHGQDASPVPTHLETARYQKDLARSPQASANEVGAGVTASSPGALRPNLRRTYTDVSPMSMQQKLMDALSQPFVAAQQAMYPDALLSPLLQPQSGPNSLAISGALGPVVHGHSTRWVPAAQAIFTTESKPPWTILAANDLACLVFGVTKAEVRKIGILEVVQEERRTWLENKLKGIDADEIGPPPARKEVAKPPPASSSGSALLGGRGGITAQLLSKPNSRSQPPRKPVRRAQTFNTGDITPSRPRGTGNHNSTKSRGVLLCGDVVPIQKRNGATGAASLWVKEKRVGLIWVLEEIHEDVAFLMLDDDGVVTKISGETVSIWGTEVKPGVDVGSLISRIPRQGIDPREGAIDYAQIAKRKYFTCRNSSKMNIPATVTQTRGQTELRVSSYPHIAGIVVVETGSLKIKSSNSVFCGALFGYEKPDGMHIDALIPDFAQVLRILTEQEHVDLRDGIVIPEHNFRKAAAFHAVRQGRPEAAANFLNPEGLPAKHRDGTELRIDVQMRVVKSEKHSGNDSGGSDDELSPVEEAISSSEPEMVFALWITYSRHHHTPRTRTNTLATATPAMSGAVTPLHQPSPGQTTVHTPQDMSASSDSDEARKAPAASSLTQQIRDAAMSAAAKLTGTAKPEDKPVVPVAKAVDAPPKGKKTIDDFVILEDMGQGAYGQVKLARCKYNGNKKVVLKYVTKRRILVDTWTRDRKLGTIPLEIHVLNYLRREDLRHPNIVEMEDFFEDETNYYIEMAPHGLPGMDLFDYIELRANMEEEECRSIFVQVAKAIHHLHTKANVVHRDIKDENVILDGEGHIKLIDFGSAAYIKSGPFDVFVGTIDYAAPEVLAGKPYGGKEQDVWALGILLYTIIYKENPFYSIDEILDRDLRVPYTISDESIDLIRCMLNRDVSQRYTIEQVVSHPWCQTEL